jgi:3-hydroxyisobutyrate dehydrogenase
MTATRVGFVGLGTMGAPMARNLARAGFALALATRTPGKARTLAAELSAQAYDTPEELARHCAVVVSCLPDSPEVEEVHLGARGTVRGAAPGTVVVDCSTIAAEAARSVADRLARSGLLWLDAPVSGGQKGAIEGALTFFVGGEESALARARPVLEAMGKRITLLGKAGAGQLGKAANQIIVAGNLVAVAEGLAFAKKTGLPLEALLGALTAGAANSWALEVLGRKMIDRDFKPAFAIRHQQKDLAIVLQTARQKGVPLPAVALVHQLLSALEAQGRGDEGTQALLTLYESMSERPESA